LVATAVGLLVAIPAVVAYNMFQRRVKRTMGEAESLAQNALGLMVGRKTEVATASPKAKD
ncbi:MAG: MotA/TolQ/ExbB proton channel family protein, partial [Myxococcales bacterium]|nr:MotA/TolQ/ExbB proton channel family protein [Myxococcales bacterium]